ncbi:hypothetical protein LCGC14_0967420, partial [marine sediment metagenome]
NGRWQLVAFDATAPVGSSYAKVRLVQENFNGSTFFDSIRLQKRISTKTTYDANGNYPIEIENAQGNIISNTFDIVGNVLTTTTSKTIEGILTDSTTNNTYDSLSRKKSVATPASGENNSTSSPAGGQITFDGNLDGTYTNTSSANANEDLVVNISPPPAMPANTIDNGDGTWTTTVTSIADNHLREGSSSNYGSYSRVELDDERNRAKRILLKFDFSSIPAGAVINDADLGIYFDDSYRNEESQGKTVWAYRLTQSNWTEMGSNWNTYNGSNSWSTAGGDYTTVDGASLSHPGRSDDNRYINFDVTNQAIYANDNLSGIADFLIKFERENIRRRRGESQVFYNSLQNTTNQPKLSVTYTAPIPSSSGSYITNAIDLPDSNTWGILVYTKTEPAGTSITIDILRAADNSVLLTDVASGTNLKDAGLSNTETSIKIRANISTDNSETPILSDWQVNVLSGETVVTYATTYFIYDLEGRITDIYYPDESSTVTNYLANSLVESVITWTWADETLTTETAYEYDIAGNLLKTINDPSDPLTNPNGLNQTTTYTYDNMSRVLTITDPAGSTVTNEYDDLGQLVSVTDPNENTTTFTYDGTGKKKTRVDALSNTTYFNYDTSGALIGTTYPQNPANQTDGLNVALGAQVISIAGGSKKTIASTSYDYPYDYSALTDGLTAADNYTYNYLPIEPKPALTIVLDKAYAIYKMKVYLNTGDSRTQSFKVETSLDNKNFKEHAELTDVSGMQEITLSAPQSARFIKLTAISSSISDFFQVSELEAYTSNQTVTYAYDGEGRLLSQTDTQGYTTYNYYNQNDQLSFSVDAKKNTSRFVYDTLSRKVKTIDPLGNSVSTTYDEVGNAIEAYDQYGIRQIAKTLDVANNLRETIKTINEQDQINHITKINYDIVGRVIMTQSFRLNADGTADATITNTKTYDALGRVDSTTDALGFSTSQTYDALGRVVTATDKRGNSISTTYYANNKLDTLTNQIDSVSKSVYDANGNIVSVTADYGLLNQEITFVYDKLNRLISVIDPRSNESISKGLTYTISALPWGSYPDTNDSEFTDGELSTTWANSFGYYIDTNFISVDIVVDLQTSMSVDKALISSGGGSANYRADSVEIFTSTDNINFTSQGSSTGTTQELIVEFSPTEARYVKFRINKQGYGFASAIDWLFIGEGQVFGKENFKTTFTYDERSNMTSKTDSAGTTNYVYDDNNRLVESIDPLSNSTFFTYDAEGLMLTATSTAKNIIKTYDANNRLKTETLNKTETFNGDVYSYTYDKKGRLTQVTNPDTSEVNYTYDEADRLTSKKIDGVNTHFYTYDSHNNIVELTQNGTTYTYEYDARDSLKTIKNSGIEVASFTYDANGNLLNKTINGLSTNYVYDLANRLVSSTSPLENNALVYDNLNRLTSFDGKTFQYDIANQLINDGDYTYTYDGNGNLLTRTNKVTLATINYTYNAANQLISDGVNTYSYEVDVDGQLVNTGNMVSDGNFTYVYDDKDRLVEVKQGASTIATYTYNNLGQRISKTVGANATTYTYNDLTRMLSSQTDSSGTTNFNGVPGKYGQMVSIDIAGVTYYYVYDAIGQIIGLTDTGGTFAVKYTYDSWGNATETVISPTFTAGSNPYLYKTYYYDEETGLYYLEQRYYNPNIARFLTKDPLPGKVTDRLSTNPYIYVANNPITNIDPDGRHTIKGDAVTPYYKYRHYRRHWNKSGKRSYKWYKKYKMILNNVGIEYGKNQWYAWRAGYWSAAAKTSAKKHPNSTKADKINKKAKEAKAKSEAIKKRLLKKLDNAYFGPNLIFDKEIKAAMKLLVETNNSEVEFILENKVRINWQFTFDNWLGAYMSSPTNLINNASWGKGIYLNDGISPENDFRQRSTSIAAIAEIIAHEGKHAMLSRNWPSDLSIGFLDNTVHNEYLARVAGAKAWQKIKHFDFGKDTLFDKNGNETPSHTYFGRAGQASEYAVSRGHDWAETWLVEERDYGNLSLGHTLVRIDQIYTNYKFDVDYYALISSFSTLVSPF